MKIPELAALYALVGVGCAVSLLAARRNLTPSTAVDTILLTTLWPLYGPFLLLRQQATETSRVAETAVLDALQRAAGTPLASLLPDEATAQALERRLVMARARIAEINALLTQPEFCEEAAEARQQELEHRGDTRAALTARQRVQSIGRLRHLRDRFSSELAEISELLVQLRIQAEVVRLSGAADEGARDLVGELVVRLEGLDEMLGGDQPATSA